MKKIATDFYEITTNNNLGTIFFKNNVFELLCNRDESDLLFEYLQNLRNNRKVKAVLFLNEPGCFGEVAYGKFLNKIMLPEIKSKEFEMQNFCDKKSRNLELHTLNRFVQYLANYGKLCVTVLRGDIVTPFFSLALATDLRYATPETFFSFAHNKYGIHPSGGLPYFLVHQLGYNRAIELMFSESISSQKALELGLINKIVPNEDFLEVVIKDIERITKFNNSVLTGTKLLSSFVRNSLSDYFEYEESF